MDAPSLIFTAQQKAAYRATYLPNATQEQADIFFIECERRALVPGQHVVFQLRAAKEWNPTLRTKVDVQKVTLITTIGALRLIAERSGKFKGYGNFTYFYTAATVGEAFKESRIPLGTVPHAVGVELFREGWAQPVFAVARYDAYVQTYKAGEKDLPTTMWRTRGEEQLAKCAEALGLRMVAPEECGGLYLDIELAKDLTETGYIPAAETAAPVVIPEPTVAPTVNQAPARMVETLVPEQGPRIETTRVPVPVEKTKPPAPVQTKTPPPPVPRPRATPPPVPAKPTQANPVAPIQSNPVVESSPVPNRLPADEGNSNETIGELNAFADRVARDPDPAHNAHGVVITDEDLPENLRPGYTPEKTATGGTAQAAALLAPPPVAQNTPKEGVSLQEATAAAVGAATKEEFHAFINGRAAKVVRDKCAAHKNAGVWMKEYLLRGSGKTKITHISAAKFEELISKLETATAEDTVKILKG